MVALHVFSILLIATALSVCRALVRNAGNPFCRGGPFTSSLAGTRTTRFTPPSLSVLAATRTADKDVVAIMPNYNVAIGSGVLTAASVATQNVGAAVAFGLLTALLAVQTGRIKFTFDDEALEVFSLKKDADTGEAVNASNENFVVGGQNRWKYDTWNSWFFIPSSSFPILFYFNEDATHNGEKGQLHLFPCIVNAKQLEEVILKKVGPK